MMCEERLEELALLWEQRREAGQDTSPESICACAGEPELVEPLRERIRDLEAAERFMPRPSEADLAGATAHLRRGRAAAGAGPVGGLASLLPARYRLQAEVACGGMGLVVRVHDEVLDRDLALKALPESDSTPELESRFRAEARITGRLQHPGVPPVHDLGELRDGRPFFTMKLVQGHTLAELLRRRSNPREGLEGWLRVFEQVCQTVAYAHSQGVIHRDLKPLNVMVGAFGEVQVMDWGLAKSLTFGQPGGLAPLSATTGCPREPGLTEAGDVLGTPAYMAPEQARGESVDERADVFGLGAILCEILTGSPAFVGGSAEVLALAQAGRLAPARERLEASGADRELVELALLCLVAVREIRPRTGGDVARAMQAHREGVQERLRQSEQARAAAAAREEDERKFSKHLRIGFNRLWLIGFPALAALCAVPAMTGYRPGPPRSQVVQDFLRELENQRHLASRTMPLDAEPAKDTPKSKVRKQDVPHLTFGKVIQAAAQQKLDWKNPHDVTAYAVWMCCQGKSKDLVKQMGYVQEDADLGESVLSSIKTLVGPDLERYKGKEVYLKFHGYYLGTHTSLWYYWLTDKMGKNLEHSPWVFTHRSHRTQHCALTGLFLTDPENKGSPGPMPYGLVTALEKETE
jgi:serine/threonine protein kinase